MFVWSSIWPGSPGRAGGSRSASSRPRTRQGWTTTRSGPGEPGMPTSPCPCSPLPGWPARKPLPQKGNRRPRPRHDQLHATGNPPTARAPHSATRPPTRARLVLVPLAKTTPAPSPRQPLPRTRLPTLSAVAVLAATALICFIFAWNEFFLAVNLTTTNAATVPIFLVGFVAPEGQFWAHLSAAATVACLPVLLAGWAAQDKLVRGLSMGAVK